MGGARATFGCTLDSPVSRRSLVVPFTAALATFAIALGGFVALGSPSARPHLRVHVKKPVFGGHRVAGMPGEFAGQGCTIQFTDDTHNHDWHTAANWSPVRVPRPSDLA